MQISLYRSQVDFGKLKRNGLIVAEALARYMYNLSDKVSGCKTQTNKNKQYLIKSF